jgi:hypothetical protein
MDNRLPTPELRQAAAGDHQGPAGLPAPLARPDADLEAVTAVTLLETCRELLKRPPPWPDSLLADRDRLVDEISLFLAPGHWLNTLARHVALLLAADRVCLTGGAPAAVRELTAAMQVGASRDPGYELINLCRGVQRCLALALNLSGPFDTLMTLESALTELQGRRRREGACNAKSLPPSFVTGP